jgi:hypothetical protein
MVDLAIRARGVIVARWFYVVLLVLFWGLKLLGDSHGEQLLGLLFPRLVVWWAAELFWEETWKLFRQKHSCASACHLPFSLQPGQEQCNSYPAMRQGTTATSPPGFPRPSLDLTPS